MPTYEERLSEFSEEKRLPRLPHPVRDRADAYCDTCGSSLPRTLYAIKDLESERYFFVGDTCLKELAKLGTVLRRYGRESGQNSFESEMMIRAQELERKKDSSKADDGRVPETADLRSVLGPKWRNRSNVKCVRRFSRRSLAMANSP